MILTACFHGLLACCAFSYLYWLTAWWRLRSELRRITPAPAGPFAPMVSVLKPVKGLDAGALENFASFCEQEYPKYEILFGVANAQDPAVAVIEQTSGRYPQLNIRCIVADSLGANPKAAILHALDAEARGDVLVISDSDIRVTPDYLPRVVAPLAEADVGLVTCLYRGESPQNTSARLEALHMDATFAPSVALAHWLGTSVGLGATLAIRRTDLARAGGYAAIKDHLLDDYEVADRVARLGLRIRISDCTVASVLGPMRFYEQWGREVRWARGIRAAHPWSYPPTFVTFSVPLGLISCAFSGIWPWAWAVLPVSLTVRFFVAWRCAALMGQRERGYLLWLAVRDVMSACVWFAALIGHRVSWRGRTFSLRRDGRLEPLPGARLPDGLLARAVRRLDAFLRRRQGIFDFSDDERCLLRVSVAAADEGFRFPGGSRIARGDAVGVLHLRNEHLPVIPRGGPDLRWAGAMRRGMAMSLKLLADAVERDPRLRGLPAFGANAVFVSRNGDSQVARLVGRYGFEWVTLDRPPGFWRRFHNFWENFLLFGLQWAFNPAGLRGKGFARPREPIWISREKLLEMYGSAASGRPERPEPVSG